MRTCGGLGQPRLSLDAVRAREGKNATSAASAYDLVHFDLPKLPPGRLRTSVQRLASLSGRAGSGFGLQPHLLTSCNHTVFFEDPEQKMPHILQSLSRPAFHSLGHYCAVRQQLLPPSCPPRGAKGALPLQREEVFFAVVTTKKFVESRGRIMTRAFGEQNASFSLFADAASPGVRELPVSGHLEQMAQNRDGATGRPGLTFIAQKHLELIHTLAQDSRDEMQRTAEVRTPRHRWWVIADDDSFVFVRRLVQTLDLLDDSQPLFVGGAHARSHLCGSGLCDYKRYVAQNGFGPVIHALAGGPAYAFSTAGLQAVAAAISEGRCLDANLGDLATAACARIAKVPLFLLPGGWLVNDPHEVGQLKKLAKTRNSTGKSESDMAVLKHEVVMRNRFSGQLLSVHKLTDRQTLCWLAHGECDPRCDCVCPCTLPQTSNHRLPRAPGGSCHEPANSTCNFQCTPASTWPNEWHDTWRGTWSAALVGRPHDHGRASVCRHQHAQTAQTQILPVPRIAMRTDARSAALPSKRTDAGSAHLPSKRADARTVQTGSKRGGAENAAAPRTPLMVGGKHLRSDGGHRSLSKQPGAHKRSAELAVGSQRYSGAPEKSSRSLSSLWQFWR